MKKFIKTILTLTLALAITFAFAGCKVVEPEGTWVCNKMKATVSYTGTTVNLMQWGGMLEINLNEDGTMEMTGYIPAATYEDKDLAFYDSGTWTLDGTAISLAGEVEENVAEWNNNKLTYTVEKVLYDPDKDVAGDEAKITVVCELVLKV